MNIYRKTDIGIAFGSGLNRGTGGEILPELHVASELNVDTAVRLFNDKDRFDNILFAGGHPMQDDASVDFSEASLMRDRAVRSHVPMGRMVLESNSTSTIGGWALSMNLLQKHMPDVRSVTAIATAPHMARVKRIGEHMSERTGIQVEYISSSTLLQPGIKRLVSEPIAIMTTVSFLNQYGDIELEDMPQVYEEFKNRSGINSAKRHTTAN